MHEDIQTDIHLEPPKKKTFEAWHKPRKHWVREHHWFSEIRDLLTKSNTDDVVNYLTLPGPDFFDIRHISNRMKHTNKLKSKKLRFFGFLSGNDKYAESAVTESGIMDLENIDAQSIVKGQRFEQIANNGTDRPFFEDQLGFDAINLDLTNSFLASEDIASRYAQGLEFILNFQNTNMNKPFLLFLTTRAGKSDTDVKLFKNTFMPLIQLNFENSQKFNSAIQTKWPTKWEDNIIQSDFHMGFGTGIAKWLLALVKNKWYITTKLVNFYSVRTNDNHNQMLSMAFLFERVSVEDKSELTKRSSSTTKVIAEEDLALEALNKCLNAEDVDQIIEDNRETQKKVYQGACDLLDSAGYDIKEYDKWLKQNSTHLTTIV